MKHILILLITAILSGCSSCKEPEQWGTLEIAYSPEAGTGVKQPSIDDQLLDLSSQIRALERQQVFVIGVAFGQGMITTNDVNRLLGEASPFRQ